jgi:DNA invertase Pin-like site-specific DNA recombinase
MATFGPSDWMKNNGTTVLQYTRISDNQQSKEDKRTPDAKKKPALIQQKEFIDESLKANGLPKVKKANWFAEVESGTNRDRPQWKAMMSKALELTNEGKRVFIVVQDPSRWSRNTRHSMVAIDRLHEMGVPVFAAREGIQTGSIGDLHPSEELLFIQLQGGAAFVSQEQKKKADQSVEISKEKGTVSGKGQSLFPFARKDPYEAYLEQLPLASLKPKEGGGPTKFRETVAALSAPEGPSIQGVKRMGEREVERMEKLTDAELQEWREYRKMIRDMLAGFNHDPFARATKSGPINFRAQALMRMVGRYLAEPWEYAPRTQEEIAEIVGPNFKEYLGTKALKRYIAIVGKR